MIDKDLTIITYNLNKLVQAQNQNLMKHFATVWLQGLPRREFIKGRMFFYHFAARWGAR